MEFYTGFNKGILQRILLLNFIKDFGKEIYKVFFEGIPNNDINKIKH